MRGPRPARPTLLHRSRRSRQGGMGGGGRGPERRLLWRQPDQDGRDQRRPERPTSCAEKYLNPNDYTTGADVGDDQHLYTGHQDDVSRRVGQGNDPAYGPQPDQPNTSNVNIFGSAHSGGFNAADVPTARSTSLTTRSISKPTAGWEIARNGLTIDAKQF